MLPIWNDEKTKINDIWDNEILMKQRIFHCVMGITAAIWKKCETIPCGCILEKGMCRPSNGTKGAT